MPGPFYFAYCGPGQAYDVSMQRFDERVLGIEINHTEGDFAQLRISIKNPRIGLLAPGRDLWAWLSWDSGAGIIPLIYGRIVGAPDNLHLEKITLVFQARPLDFIERKAALANSLRVLPWWDPVWLVDKVDDPDTVLETRTALWHVDRVTHAVTISDILVGEAGVIEIEPTEHLYEHMEVNYDQPPLRAVTVTASVSWNQVGSGDVDLTRELVQAFQAAGSSANYPMVSTFTGDGLYNSWPKPGANIGGGWSMSADSFINQASIDPDAPAPAVVPNVFPRNWLSPVVPPQYILPGTYHRTYGFSAIAEMFSKPGVPLDERGAYSVDFPLHFYVVNFRVHYDASRQRSEVVSFNLAADVQSVQTEPDLDFVLNTTGDTLNASPTVQNIGSLAGVVPGIRYQIAGAGIPPGNTFIAPDEGQWGTPGFVLNTTADTRAGSTFLDHAGSIAGLIPGVTYAIAATTIPGGATFVAPASGASFRISAPATTDGDAVPIAITAIVSGLAVEMKDAATGTGTGVALTITLPAANAVEQETISVSSALVDQPVDVGGNIPIGDLRLNSYFRTDRGNVSFEFLILLARAKLLARSRVVKIKFRTRWIVGIGLSCRHSIRLFDGRLPGGEATGKVIAYSLIAGAGSGQYAEVHIACSIGRGDTLAPSDGTPDYVENGYAEPGYERYTGGLVTLLPGEIQYQSFDEFVLDDDGVDLLSMTPENVLLAGQVDGVGLTISTTGSTLVGSNGVHLDNTDGLENGLTYSISGPGIPSDSQFLFLGSTVSLNRPATATGTGVALSITGVTTLTSANGISVVNGPPDQRAAVDRAIDGASGVPLGSWSAPALPDPVAALSAAPTRVAVNLVSVKGGPFQTLFEPAVSMLMVPKAIDLEAPSA